MLVVLLSLVLITVGLWFLDRKAKQTERRHELRLHHFLEGLQEGESGEARPMELVKRIRKNPQYGEDP